MSGKRLIAGFISFLSTLVLLVVILLTVIEQNAFDIDFFKAEYSKLNSTEVIGISEHELMITTQGLLAYIKGERDNLNIRATIKGENRQVFNEREIRHMVDVQRLYATAHWCRNAGLILVLILLGAAYFLTGRRFLKYWAGGYLVGTTLFLILLGVVAAAVNRDFLLFWDSFHHLIFTNDLWLLNPETDILIQIVPEQFFLDLVIRILSFFTAAMVLLAAAAGRILYRSR